MHSQFHCLFCFGVQEVEDVVDIHSRIILEFVEERQFLLIPPNYGFIWQQYNFGAR